uniref:Tubulin polyglutamylase complex subunit 2 n=2 Tax=Cacopsylla melanoneura TaxID=428564 RepID=A0A8D8TGM2_9HEMI
MSSDSEHLVDTSFYDNLTLGLIKILEKTPGIQDVELEQRPPCERALLAGWEQRNGCVLPDDLRQFYTSVDGFKLIWNYNYAGEILPVGNMVINSLSGLKKINCLKCQLDPDTPTFQELDNFVKQNSNTKLASTNNNYGPKTKFFELDACQNAGKVCLVYTERQKEELFKLEESSIWFLDRSYCWHFLAENFAKYFRMMLVHLGLPQWQFLFTAMGPTPWAEQMIVLIAPHLLTDNKIPVTSTELDEVINRIDPNIFKPKSKSLKSKKTIRDNEKHAK